MSAQEVQLHPYEFLYGDGVMLCCGVDGQITRDGPEGFYAGDTRILSTYRFSIAGQGWHMLGRVRPAVTSARWDYQNAALLDAYGDLPAGTLLLTLKRRLAGALHDDIEIRSFARRPVLTRLTLQIDADFADLFEVKEDSIMPRLSVARIPTRDGFVMEYRHGRFHRALELSFRSEGPRPLAVGALLLFELSIAPGATWSCCVDAEPQIGGRRLTFRTDPHEHAGAVPAAPSPAVEAPFVEAPPLLAVAYECATADLAALAMPQDGGPPYPAGGMPWFLALFGRDTLMTALMASLAGPWLAEGALYALGRLQATERDDWRDAEPGKIPHELRVGELAQRGFIPHTPYYGTHDAPELYCLALWEAWRWTGARALLDAHLDTARRALEWCERWGDRDGDGLLEYQTRSRAGYRNQGWKDAHDAIVHADGRQAEPPLATVELQGYWYAARLAMAEMLEAAGEAAHAERERAAALLLRARIEERYWMDSEGTYCVALDRRKRPVSSVTSNPGHLLWCGVPSADRAARVAARFLAPDMFSGWGLRTLSSSNPAYDPLSYQRGSVWPHDTALAAAGMWRYGLREDACVLFRALLEAAASLEDNRLPELFCGVERAHGGPIPYEQASSPQAWAAAAPILMLRTFLGLVPDAPHGRCSVDPWLPEWLPSVAVRGVRVGDGVLALEVAREGKGAAAVSDRGSRSVDVVHAHRPEAPLYGRIA